MSRRDMRLRETSGTELDALAEISVEDGRAPGYASAR
jgi:hypothetical protein